MNKFPPVTSCWLGSVPYRDAWELQQKLVEEVRAGDRPETLLLLEHPHVFTLGRRGSEDHVLWDAPERTRRAVEMVWCDRGGDVTYHGPGQLVAYPILDLSRRGGDVVGYVRDLETSIIRYLANLGLEAEAVAGYTGVWIGGAKVAAIGVKATGAVVSHGLALNVATDLGYFAGIVPCGISDKPVTSVEQLLGRPIATAEAARGYAESFAAAFDVDLIWADHADAFAGSPAGRGTA